MDHLITLQQAIEMTSLYRKVKEDILKPEYQDKNILNIAETFNRSIFDKLLATPGCSSIRIYFGMNPDQQLRCILVAVNDKNEDILPSGTTTSADEEPVIGEDGLTCPPICGTTSPLNP
jgi:hypothetical protein